MFRNAKSWYVIMLGNLRCSLNPPSFSADFPHQLKIINKWIKPISYQAFLGTLATKSQSIYKVRD